MKLPMKGNYQTFYKDAIQNKQGYVTKDGSWAAIPLMGCKKLQIIHNGEFVHVARNYDFAVSYIKKQVSKQRKDERSKRNRREGNEV
jgi:effector-binding domain-containing protein